MIKNRCPVIYLSGIRIILCKHFELISLRSIKIPKVRELNFWREEEKDEDETLVCIYISPHGKYLKTNLHKTDNKKSLFEYQI